MRVSKSMLRSKQVERHPRPVCRHPSAAPSRGAPPQKDPEGALCDIRCSGRELLDAVVEGCYISDGATERNYLFTSIRLVHRVGSAICF
jgi:hypothetical protein